MKYSELVSRVSKINKRLNLLEKTLEMNEKRILLTRTEIIDLILKHPTLTYKELSELYPNLEYTWIKKGYYCENFTSIRSNLARQGKIITPFICDVCGKKYFLSLTGLNKHKMMVHKEERENK